MYRRVGKRLFDVAVTVPALLALVVPLGVLAAGVWLAMGRPVFFRQRRAGWRGREFDVIKFRTMRDGPGDDAERLTRFGRWLRRTSLDELPELWNVLRGDMSLVGPRPLLVRYLPRYTPLQARRHEVRPGLTGWAQVNGRNSTTWDQRFALDVWYVDHVSWLWDLRILWRTVAQVISGRDVSSAGHATMPEFMGEQR